MSLKKKLICLLFISFIMSTLLFCGSFYAIVAPVLRGGGGDSRVFGGRMLALVGTAAIVSLALASALYLLLDKYLVGRLQRISASIREFEKLRTPSMRVETEGGHDEISHLVSFLNTTLDHLEKERLNRERTEQLMIGQGKLASIGKLSSTIAHEINSPLLAIANSVQAIKQGVKRKSAPVAEALQISETEINRIRDIISGLLSFHHLEQERFSHLRLNEIIGESIDLVKWSHKPGVSRIIPRIDGDIMLFGSSVKLRQVFINLIMNALEAMADTEGTLRVEAHQAADDKNSVEIHFIDNGPGIPDEIKEHLFEPFVSSISQKGVGLGLYISHKIIMNHNGQIFLKEGQRGGAHFIIRLPISPEVRP